LITSGVDPEAAIKASVANDEKPTDILKAILRNSGFANSMLRRFHVGDGGPLDKIPDARCVARALDGNEKPTREEVIQAFAKCSG